MILTIKKLNKRNRTKYSVVGVYCPIGYPVLTLLKTDGKTISLNRHQLEFAELEIIHSTFPRDQK